MNNQYRMEKEMSEWISKMDDWSYYLTLTTKHNDFRLDETVNRFLKVIHSKLFSRNYKKHKKYLTTVICGERQLRGTIHYHMIIKGDPLFHFDELVSSVIYATKYCENIKDLPDDTYTRMKLSTNYAKDSTAKGDKNIPLNLVEIQTNTDKEKICNYILKEFYRTQGDNLYFFNKDNNFNIVTKI